MTRRSFAPLAILFLLFPLCAAGPATAAIVHVPGDQPTIQQGIFAASAGDTVLVACGTYTEHDIFILPGRCLRSETGNPDCVTVNALGQGRVFYCNNIEADTRIEGLTITGASLQDDYGGGLYCQHSSPVISNCVFTGNLAHSGGSAIYCLNSSNPTIENCRIQGNLRSVDGGAIYCTYNSAPTIINTLIQANSCMFWGGAVFCQQSSPHLIGCTLEGNSAQGNGGGIWCVYDSHPVIENTIIADCPNGEGVYIYPNGGHQSTVTMLCSDVFGNVDGNYGGAIEDPTGHDGNISADPLFCSPSTLDFHVADSSPCLPEHNSCGVLMGAFGAGCSMPAAVSEIPAEGPFGLRVTNPFPTGGGIEFSLPSAGQVSLALFDCSGRKVRRVVEASGMSAGVHRVLWDGRDDSGNRLVSGVYFCRLSAAGRSELVKLTLEP